MTMNHTIYSPRTDIAIGIQHNPFMQHHQQPAANFIYFKMMQVSSSSVELTSDTTTTSTTIVHHEKHQEPKIMSKGKEHFHVNSTPSSTQTDPMQEDEENDEDWIDMDDEEGFVSPQQSKSRSFYFRYSEESDNDEEESDNDHEDDDEQDEEIEEEDFIEIPFWYGNEDPKHVEYIMREYSSFLQLNKDRQPKSRLPIRFIGKIVREALEDTIISVRDEDDEDSSYEEDSLHMQRVLITSETIYIYQKSVQCPELCCKFDTSVTVQTFYDYEEGVPISILIQPETEWDISSLDNVTLLECFPSFGMNPYVFEYGSHRVSETDEILPHNLETDLGNAGLFNQCLQNSAGYLAKLKPKQIDSPKAE